MNWLKRDVKQERKKGCRTPIQRDTKDAVWVAACKIDNWVTNGGLHRSFMMTKEELKSAGLFSCNGLADELGVDRRSIKKHLIDEEADHVQKGIKYID